MKHIFDKRSAAKPSMGLRYAYQRQKIKRPAAASLLLQRRRRLAKAGASGTRQFLRIERGFRA